MLAHVDDDELEKNGPNRIKARNRPPTWEHKLREVDGREESKLAKVRGEKHRDKEKNADYLDLSNSFLTK
jgi:hypothetical protein